MELQQSFLDIFGVAQNFWFNGGGFIAQKGGGADAHPLEQAQQSIKNVKTLKNTNKF